jgi:DNA-binding LytR/AlgR family response regulator
MIRKETMIALNKHSTLRELRKVFTNKIVIISYLTLTALSIITGPFNTYQQISLVFRIPYWAGVIAFCFIAAILVHHFLEKMSQNNMKQKIFSQVIKALLIAITIAIFLFILNSLLWGDIDTLPDFDSYLMLTIPISLVLTIMRSFFTSFLETKTTKQKIALLRRLPAHLGSNILYLSVQDHYVEVITNKGSHLILMRFSDAIAELKGLEGIQIHRSFWVSLEAVETVKKLKGKTILRMSNKKELPISRTYLADVKKTLEDRIL